MVVVAGVSSLGSRGGTQQQSLDRLIHWGLPRKSSWGPRPPGKEMIYRKMFSYWLLSYWLFSYYCPFSEPLFYPSPAFLSLFMALFLAV